jgi:hypothetical protein
MKISANRRTRSTPLRSKQITAGIFIRCDACVTAAQRI